MTDYERITEIVRRADLNHNLMNQPLEILWLVKECPAETIEQWRADHPE